METIPWGALEKYMDSNYLKGDNQCGFRKARASLTNLLDLYHEAKDKADNRLCKYKSVFVFSGGHVGIHNKQMKGVKRK